MKSDPSAQHKARTNKSKRKTEGDRERERDDWAREYWGPELVEIVEDDGENNTRGRPEPRAPLPPQRGVEGRPEPRARRFTSPSPPDQDDKGVRP